MNVDAIFLRAERVFEQRVDTLLHAKRCKALQSGAAFNARKAKRDARTVAGREKLDALVRRLADLAAAQHALLSHQSRRIISQALDGTAAAVIGIAAYQATPAPSPSAATSTATTSPITTTTTNNIDVVANDGSSCSDDSMQVSLLPVEGQQKKFQQLQQRQREIVHLQHGHGNKQFAFGNANQHMFLATQSVVDFVLDCEDEEEEELMRQRRARECVSIKPVDNEHGAKTSAEANRFGVDFQSVSVKEVHSVDEGKLSIPSVCQNNANNKNNSINCIVNSKEQSISPKLPNGNGTFQPSPPSTSSPIRPPQRAPSPPPPSNPSSSSLCSLGSASSCSASSSCMSLATSSLPSVMGIAPLRLNMKCNLSHINNSNSNCNSKYSVGGMTSSQPLSCSNQQRPALVRSSAGTCIGIGQSTENGSSYSGSIPNYGRVFKRLNMESNRGRLNLSSSFPSERYVSNSAIGSDRFVGGLGGRGNGGGGSRYGRAMTSGLTPAINSAGSYESGKMSSLSSSTDGSTFEGCTLSSNSGLINGGPIDGGVGQGQSSPVNVDRKGGSLCPSGGGGNLSVCNMNNGNNLVQQQQQQQQISHIQQSLPPNALGSGGGNLERLPHSVMYSISESQRLHDPTTTALWHLQPSAH